MVKLRRLIKSERGSVTAELAMSLPAVALVIAITLGAFSLQIERMKLVEVSATAARAVARGESEENARALITELFFPLAAESLLVEYEHRENVVCAKLSRRFALPGLEANLFDVAEVQCARKVGL
ncbi:unannotated protein [freshwater metagenome]|uniref:Unannotated protein n=1 Tax=freshwater metagenome TaxID=449393 RepID=A0A6J6HFC0_9ZZZZ|nr:hypothetical protein [Actinomycetota bacterium]